MRRGHRDVIVDGERHAFTSKRPARHDCQDSLPRRVPDGVTRDDRWKCPDCGRRWEVSDINPNDGSLHIGMCSMEGVTIKGRDGSTYWRPYRARFIGGIFL